MVYTRDISTITATAAVEDGFEQYVINVTVAGATITLPPVVSSGQYCNFIREDSSGGVVTIVPNGPGQFIWGSGTPVSSFQMPSKTSISFVTLNGNWYMLQNSSTSDIGTRSYFATSFTQNNGGLFLTLSGLTPFATQSRSITLVPYEGTQKAYLSTVNVILGCNATGRQVRVFLTNLTGTVYGEVTTSFAAANTPNLVTFPLTTNPLPAGPTILEMRGNVENGSSGRLYIYSLSIQ